jgi:hypothetical protein
MNGCLGKIINLIYCAVHMYARQKGVDEALLLGLLPVVYRSSLIKGFN